MAWREKHAAIRRDFDAGMSVRAIERERAAGTEENPREPTAMNGLHAITNMRPQVASKTSLNRRLA